MRTPPRCKGQLRGRFIETLPPGLSIQVVPGPLTTPSTRHDILHLCNSAYGAELTAYFDALTPDSHLLAKLDSQLVGHAMIVTRWLQCGTGPLLRTAYVELVATAPGHQGLGIATANMRRLATLAGELDYDLAALCPAGTDLYRRLGWEEWLGPLFIRTPEQGDENASGKIATPEERVMILRLPRSPALKLNQALSAEWRAGGELW